MLTLKVRRIAAALQELREAIDDLREDADGNPRFAFRLDDAQEGLGEFEQRLEERLLAYARKLAREEALPAPEPPRHVVQARAWRRLCDVLESAPSGVGIASVVRQMADVWEERGDAYTTLPPLEWRGDPLEAR